MKRTLLFLLILLAAALCCSCGSSGENKIILYGKEYSFPISITELTENGWEYTGDSLVIKPHTRSTLLGYECSLSYRSGDGLINAGRVLNQTESDYLPLRECAIESITIEKGDVALSAGLSLSSTPDDIVKAFGEAKSGNSNFTKCEKEDYVWRYKKQKGSYLSYTFRFDENDPSKIASITISYDKDT